MVKTFPNPFGGTLCVPHILFCVLRGFFRSVEFLVVHRGFAAMKEGEEGRVRRAQEYVYLYTQNVEECDEKYRIMGRWGLRIPAYVNENEMKNDFERECLMRKDAQEEITVNALRQQLAIEDLVDTVTSYIGLFVYLYACHAICNMHSNIIVQYHRF